MSTAFVVFLALLAIVVFVAVFPIGDDIKQAPRYTPSKKEQCFTSGGYEYHERTDDCVFRRP